MRGGLHRLLGQDRVVSVMDWNSMQFAQLLYAVPISGNIVHPVDVRQPTGQVLSSMREAGGSSCLLYSPPFKGLAEAAVSAGLVKDEFCMSIDEATGQDLPMGMGGRQDSRNWMKQGWPLSSSQAARLESPRELGTGTGILC